MENQEVLKNETPNPVDAIVESVEDAELAEAIIAGLIEKFGLNEEETDEEEKAQAERLFDEKF